MKKWILKHKILAGILAFFLFAAFMSAIAGEESANPPTLASEQPEEIIEVSANALVNAYLANEIAADQQYKGKTLEVVGFVKSVGKDILDKPYITFESIDLIRSVQCYLNASEVDKAATLKEGFPIKVKGRNSGLSMNILIKDCIILE